MIECKVLRLKEEHLDDGLRDNYDSFLCLFEKIDVMEQSFLEDGSEVVDVQVGNQFYIVDMDFKTFRQRYIGHNFGMKFS